MSTKSGSKQPTHGHNVVDLPVMKKVARQQAGAAKDGDVALPGFADDTSGLKTRVDDKRVKEAMRLAQAFLAIEDAAARRALVDLAERLVSYDWVRKVK